jgi:hypothetical protein
VNASSVQTRRDLPRSAYRSLIDATERDIELVLVAGEPLAGDVGLMTNLKPGDVEVVDSACGLYAKAIDVTRAGVEGGDETLATIVHELSAGLAALGGDHPRVGGGAADASNTYGYLQAHVPLPFPMTDDQFRQFVLLPVAGTVGDRLNLEGLSLTPLLTSDDDFFFDVLGDRVDVESGLIADPTPPYGLYPANANQVLGTLNPFGPERFERSWYSLLPQPFRSRPAPGEVRLSGPNSPVACSRFASWLDARRTGRP